MSKKPTRDDGYSSGKAIEMPPLDYKMPDELSTQDNASGSQQQAFDVPDQLPQEVERELADSSGEHERDEDGQQEGVADTQYHASKQSSAQESKKEENWRTVREAKERAERERDALMAQIIEMQKSQKSVNQQEVEPQEEEPEVDFSIADDELLEGKHAKKLINKLKSMEKKINEYHNASYASSVENKIKHDFPDFESVVSVENVKLLNQEFPELAEALRDTQDIYKKAAAAYKVIKRTGIYQDNGDIMAQKQKAEQNLKKPRPVASVSPQQGESPLARANAFANGLTPELQRQLREEMYKARRNM